MSRDVTALLHAIPRRPRPGMSKAAAAVGAQVHELDASQWESPLEIARGQAIAARRVSAYAALHSPMFAAHLKRSGLGPEALWKPGAFEALPPLQRSDLQGPADEVFCRRSPSGHLPFSTGSSSGSTGEPVSIRRSALNRRDWQAMTLRLHLWHTPAIALRMCVSRARVPAAVAAPDWGAPTNLFWRTGPALIVPNDLPVAVQAEHVWRFDPAMVMGYPSVLLAMGDLLAAKGRRPRSVIQIRTLGETLSISDRQAIETSWGCPVVDIYSSEEVGYIALQCPQSSLYHVMAETALVEILGPDGRPCRPGEVGQVVVTDLRNYVTPIIRYAIGDYAEAAGPCPCGRGLPTMARVFGRERNLLVTRDGERRWPLSGRSRYRSVAPVRQYQMIQQDYERIEVRLVVERPLTEDEEAALRNLMLDALGLPFTLDFAYFPDRLPTGPTGKLEEFVCKVEPRSVSGS